MPKIIKNGIVVDDSWQRLNLAEGETPASVTLPAGPLLVPLEVWLTRREELLGRTEPLGVWLAGADDPELIAGDLAAFSLIAIEFLKFADGRGYSTASLLRRRYGYKGELRAIGEVLRDQLFYMQRVGFDAYALRADKNIEDALASLKDFSLVYQGSVNPPLGRRAAAVVEGA